MNTLYPLTLHLVAADFSVSMRLYDLRRVATCFFVRSQ